MAIADSLHKGKQFVRLSESYLRRNNPVLQFYHSIVEGIKHLLTANKKLKIAKYRVNHLRYRLYQMEQVIDKGNPYNDNGGGNLNLLR